VNKILLMLSAVLLLAGLSSRSEAEQRALLVGVGQYVTPGIDLPAIDLDIERMHDTLIRMGFEERQIKTLVDADATSKNVIANFDSWLKPGVKADDRVVFYFTGHGSQIPDLDGDESDGVDEVLVTHDMVRARVKGHASLINVITDDKLGAMIAAIPSQNVWIIVDSCHS
jgi:metacaspase-1